MGKLAVCLVIALTYVMVESARDHLDEDITLALLKRLVRQKVEHKTLEKRQGDKSSVFQFVMMGALQPGYPYPSDKSLRDYYGYNDSDFDFMHNRLNYYFPDANFTLEEVKASQTLKDVVDLIKSKVPYLN